METKPTDVSDDGATPAEPVLPLRARQMLPPKGACWYCEKPLDSVRRFCGKVCADAFDEEAQFCR
ncbi:hypothetical protein [Janthinobacterium fluminis]|uniref:DUF2116 family Zn-ribbon domain-containing protein n=1 Tax=Janthinobacterium fluminis TaxID=2987524 RepID=A0ABT5JZI6_9BURK|nr:hypothetical protein [Janthinobacterium fluminis]MDC8758146.1 hypothetical protein [Janthinobacterium fluminis]